MNHILDLQLLVAQSQHVRICRFFWSSLTVLQSQTGRPGAGVPLPCWCSTAAQPCRRSTVPRGCGPSWESLAWGHTWCATLKVCKHLISDMLWDSKQLLQMKSRRYAQGSLPQPAWEQVLPAPGRINGFCKDKALTPGPGVQQSACPKAPRAPGRGLIAPHRTGQGHRGSSSSWDSSPCLPPTSSTLLICYKHHFKDVPALLSWHFPRALLG